MSDYNEDAILPDDFDEMYGNEDQPQSTDSQSPENSEPTDNPQTDPPQSTPEQLIPIKFNHEEQQIPLEEAQNWIQKGMNYDKIHERLTELESDPRLSFVQDLAEENDMSVEEFLEMFQAERQQAQLNQLIENNIPPELAEEILLARQDRAERARQAEIAEAEKEEQMQYLGFFEEFKALNGREFDAQRDQIPHEVWQVHNDGMPLRFAYMQHFNKELQQKLQVLTQNKLNEERSPVSPTTAYGSSDPQGVDEFLAGFDSY